jgi:uncharacterized protein (TIGR00255 family)
MTGFASVGREENGTRVSVSIKSVNHRFLDLVVKAPTLLNATEARVRAIVQQRVARGRVEVTVGLELPVDLGREVVLNEPLLDRVRQAVETARAKGLISGGLTASDVLRIPQVLEIRAVSDAASADVAGQAAALVETMVEAAVDALVAMRETEGGFLRKDLDARLSTLADFVGQVEQESRDGQGQLDARLRERLAALPPDMQGDPSAVAQEVVRFIARSDIDEEVVRLRSHFEHWRTLADNDEPCGRKLDFLVQEMNREINTIGSKAEGARSTELVIAAKAELERLREQVQNVE